MAGGNPEPGQDTTLDGGLAGRTIHEAQEFQDFWGLLGAFRGLGF